MNRLIRNTFINTYDIENHCTLLFVDKGSLVMDFMEDQAEESDVNSEDEGGRSDVSGSGSEAEGKTKSKKKAKKKSRQIISDSEEEDEEEEDGNELDL